MLPSYCHDAFNDYICSLVNYKMLHITILMQRRNPHAPLRNFIFLALLAHFQSRFNCHHFLAHCKIGGQRLSAI